MISISVLLNQNAFISLILLSMPSFPQFSWVFITCWGMLLSFSFCHKKMCVLLSLIVKVNEAFDVTFTCTVTRLFNVACFTSPVRRESVAISPEEGNWRGGWLYLEYSRPYNIQNYKLHSLAKLTTRNLLHQKPLEKGERSYEELVPGKWDMGNKGRRVVAARLLLGLIDFFALGKLQCFLLSSQSSFLTSQLPFLQLPLVIKAAIGN